MIVVMCAWKFRIWKWLKDKYYYFYFKLILTNAFRVYLIILCPIRVISKWGREECYNNKTKDIYDVIMHCIWAHIKRRYCLKPIITYNNVIPIKLKSLEVLYLNDF